MPLDQLQQNEAFNQQAYANMLLATDFIVNNLDNVGHLANLLRRLDNYNSWYVDFIDQKRQLGVSSLESYLYMMMMMIIKS